MIMYLNMSLNVNIWNAIVGRTNRSFNSLYEFWSFFRKLLTTISYHLYFNWFLKNCKIRCIQRSFTLDELFHIFHTSKNLICLARWIFRKKHVLKISWVIIVFYLAPNCLVIALKFVLFSHDLIQSV